MTLAYPWCRVLANLDDNVFAAVLDAAAAELRQREPDLVALRHARKREVEEHGHVLWLHIGVIFREGSRAAAPGRVVYVPGADPDHEGVMVEDQRPRLANMLQTLADRWGHCWPVLHRHHDGEPLAAYHKPRPVAVIPAPPEPFVRFVATKKRRGKADEGNGELDELDEPAAVAEPTPAPPAPPQQKGLFDP